MGSCCMTRGYGPAMDLTRLALQDRQWTCVYPVRTLFGLLPTPKAPAIPDTRTSVVSIHVHQLLTPGG